MAHRIFLVHGMGFHPEGWHQETEKLLHEFYKNYVRFNTRPFSDHFTIVPIQYDDIFRGLLKQWSDDSREVSALAAKFGVSLVQGLMSWARNADDVEDNFLWTHAFDVILYRYIDLIRESVKHHVANQIANELKTLHPQDSWSIIAHSLGTAVIHDTMHSWYTQPIEGIGQLGRNRRPTLIMMVANVSRLLQGNEKNSPVYPKVYESTVRPGQACMFYYNVYHPKDPFTLIRPFEPVVWPDRQRHIDAEYRRIVVEHIQQVNIHDFNHYLRHPAVIIPLFELLDREVTLAKEEEYITNFNPVGKLTDSSLISIRQKLEDMGAGLPSGWVALVALWGKYNSFLSSLA